LNIVGNKKLLPKDLRDSLHRVELETKKYSDKVINMLIGYGGRDDLMSAARSIAKKFPKGNVTEEEFGNFLISRSIPEIDFVIRTSGEKRLSGFMPWQAGYAELYFSKKLWPDFTRNDLHAALVDYSNRQRRFGR
jgi:undecaprenyl diphosphate synthase